MLAIPKTNRFIVSIWLTLFSMFIVACNTEAIVSPTLVPTSTLLPATQTPPPPSPTLSPSLTPVQVNSKYGFENELTGWIPQTYENAMACFQVSQSDEKAKDGLFSLKLDMDLIGGNESKSQGEAWVDMRNFPPIDEALPLKSIDFTNRTITMWVYAPAGSVGDNSKPNGLQIFVKDVNFKSNYGAWTNIVENQWIQLSFAVTASAVENGYVDKGFDPSQIIVIGIKMGSGGGSTAIYNGPIYIDAVNW
jgi:hypothetical protein